MVYGKKIFLIFDTTQQVFAVAVEKKKMKIISRKEQQTNLRKKIRSDAPSRGYLLTWSPPFELLTLCCWNQYGASHTFNNKQARPHKYKNANNTTNWIVDGGLSRMATLLKLKKQKQQQQQQ